ncbi:MAG TPA: secretin N-terminal domain-containing protein, partial [Pirellulaceae bacterium]|nr:secretin N-terminal domain-containing protein [Pirellulaceae bacterium]
MEFARSILTFRLAWVGVARWVSAAILVLYLAVAQAQGGPQFDSTAFSVGDSLVPRSPLAPQFVPLPQANSLIDLVDFREQPLDDAIRTFSEQSGLNIVASREAGKTIINLFLRNIRAIDVLENLTKTHNLYYRVDEVSGIVRIFTTREYERNLASFRDEQTQVFTLLYPNPIDVAVAIRDLFGERVSLNFGVGDEDSILELIYRLNRFDLVDSRSLGLGSFNGTYAIGSRPTLSGITGIGGFGANVRRQFPDPRLAQSELMPLRDLTAEQIQQLISAVESKRTEGPATPQLPGEDVIDPVSQLLKERQATIYVTVIRRNNQVVVRTGDRETMEQVQMLIHSLDVPTPLVLLEVKVMSILLDDRFRSVFDYQFSDGGSGAGGFTTGDVLPTPSDALIGEARRLASMLPGGAVLNQGDLTFQFVSNR